MILFVVFRACGFRQYNVMEKKLKLKKREKLVVRVSRRSSNHSRISTYFSDFRSNSIAELLSSKIIWRRTFRLCDLQTPLWARSDQSRVILSLRVAITRAIWDEKKRRNSFKFWRLRRQQHLKSYKSIYWSRSTGCFRIYRLRRPFALRDSIASCDSMQQLLCSRKITLGINLCKFTVDWVRNWLGHEELEYYGTHISFVRLKIAENEQLFLGEARNSNSSFNRYSSIKRLHPNSHYRNRFLTDF